MQNSHQILLLIFLKKKEYTVNINDINNLNYNYYHMINNKFFFIILFFCTFNYISKIWITFSMIKSNKLFVISFQLKLYVIMKIKQILMYTKKIIQQNIERDISSRVALYSFFFLNTWGHYILNFAKCLHVLQNIKCTLFIRNSTIKYEFLLKIISLLSTKKSKKFKSEKKHFSGNKKQNSNLFTIEASVAIIKMQTHHL